MCLSNEAAAIKLAERDNLVGELVKALSWAEMHFRRDGEGSQDHFDRVAEAFRNDTGYLRPGQDCRMHDEDVRQEAWTKWMNDGKERMRALIAKAREGAQS